MASVADHLVETPGGWDFVCPVTDGTCKQWASTGWPTAELAEKRGLQHIEEHIEGEAAKAENRPVDQSKVVSLHDFRVANGVTVTDDGQAVVTAKDFA